MGYCKHSLRQHMQSTLHSAGYIINIRKCCYKCNDLILHMIVILDMIQDCFQKILILAFCILLIFFYYCVLKLWGDLGGKNMASL